MSACIQKDQKLLCPWATILVTTSCEPAKTDAELDLKTKKMLFIRTQKACFYPFGGIRGFVIVAQMTIEAKH